MKKLYLLVTKDEYELPIIVTDSVKELAEFCGDTVNNILSCISTLKNQAVEVAILELNMRLVKMINTKGEWIYTNSEIAYELGLSPATVNSIAKKLYGVRVPHWTIAEVKMICEYIKSITIEEDSKRLKLLHDTVCECGFEPFEEDDLRKRVSKDITPRCEDMKLN